MSELSYLEKLLNGTEIEWLPLSSLCKLITTGKLNANAMEDNGAYPFLRVMKSLTELTHMHSTWRQYSYQVMEVR